MKKIPILSIIGWSNTGKTTLIGDLIEIYRNLGLKAAVIKRTHDMIEMDKKGSDSWSYGKRGPWATGLGYPGGGYFFFPGFSWSDESLRRIFLGANVIICEGLRLDGYPVFQTAGNLIRIDELKGKPEDWTGVITGNPQLKRELAEFNIIDIDPHDLSIIPDITLKSQPVY